MPIYNYARSIVNGAYDINNQERGDPADPTTLCSEICAIPEFDGHFDIKCSGSSCDIVFDFTLSGAQETQLDTIVSNHKNNT